MKVAGAILFLIGLLLGIYSLDMDVGVDVDVPAASYGYGVETPAMRVANVDRIEQRRNLNMLSGALIIGGVLLVGFGAIAQKNTPARLAEKQPADPVRPRVPVSPAAPTEVSICPKCRAMYSGGEKICRCGHEFT